MSSTLDNGIPLLTEILQPPETNVAPVTDAIAATSATTADFDIAPRLMPPPTTLHEKSVALPALGSDAWQQLEIDVTERIARQVLQRIDFVLEQRVRDSLADVLQVAVEGLATEIRAGLHQTLQEVIARAVTQELSHLQNQKI